MDVPKKVLKAMAEEIAMGREPKMIGETDGAQTWVCVFPDDSDLGLPRAYVYREKKPVLVLDGFDTVAVLDRYSDSE